MSGRIAVLSTLALKGVLDRFRPELEQSLGATLDARFDATQAIVKLLESGAAESRCDVLILTAEAMQPLEKAGHVKAIQLLGSSGVGVAVRAGAPKPGIGSLEAFKRAMQEASSVAHSKVGASGLYFAGLIDSVPLQLKRRVVVEKGPVGRVVASGEAEIGIQQLCELAPVPGIDIVGPLPAPIQRVTHFAAGISAGAANAKGAAALIAQLRSPRIRAGMAQGGIEPAS
ncbi:MAG TPA: substrate-binding domain-containing protein [Burkholderiales bacterium]|nr:substrate-binding domain-containing protein [Burkholderiales bacterium]